MSERSEVTFKLRAIADGYDCFPWRGEEMAGFAGRILNLLGGSEEAETPGELDHPYSPRPEDPGGNCACGEPIEAHDPVPPRDKDIGSGGAATRKDAGEGASGPSSCVAPGASDPCSTCGGEKVVPCDVCGGLLKVGKRTVVCGECGGAHLIPCPACTTTEEE